MRLAILAVVAAGCGGHPSRPAASPGALPSFAAARWVPETPLYVLASPSVADAQRAARDAIELVSVVTGFDPGDVVRASTALLGVDALHGDPLAAIGVDLHGGWTMFSEDLSPTLVVHLAAPAQMAAFVAHQRQRGLVTRSAVVDNVEVTSATLPGGVTLSWAIDGDWMWLHLGATGAPDAGARWFTASHGPHSAGWTGRWAWAQRAAGAAATLVGVLDLHGMLAGALARLPDAVACARIVEPVGQMALAVEGDERHVSTRIGLEIGGAGATERLRSTLLPPPSGWAATAARAAIAAQWNLDLAALRAWIAPCLAAAGGQLAIGDDSVRAARAVLLGLDADAMSGSGAIALDVTGTAFLERQLDRIPLRGTLERPRTFGPYHGYSIAIPFSVTVEYVLEHQVALAALGEGVLASLVAPAAALAPSAPPIFAVDLAPPAMSAHAWEIVIHGLAERRLDGSPGPRTHRAVQHLMGWRDAHLAVTTEAGQIVFTLSGNRR